MERRREAACHPGEPIAELSADGNCILTVPASQDDTPQLWNADGKLLANLVGHTRVVSCGVFSSDGLRILTASQDNTARLWSADGKPLATLAGHTLWVTSAVFSPTVTVF